MATPVFFAKAAQEHLDEHYWPAFGGLLLCEGKDVDYPMPSASGVPNMPAFLHGVTGMAVHTEPDTTVSEGQGYAMLVAGMRRDVETLKRLAVGWIAAGQGIVGGPPCGSCGSSGDSRHPSPAAICASGGRGTGGCLCKTVDGAYLPGWRLPFQASVMPRCCI